jgi:hypothetical protein
MHTLAGRARSPDPVDGRLFDGYRLADPGRFHDESDSGPGGTANPGRSLRWAKVSASYMLSLRKDRDRDDCERGKGGR